MQRTHQLTRRTFPIRCGLPVAAATACLLWIMPAAVCVADDSTESIPSFKIMADDVATKVLPDAHVYPLPGPVPRRLVPVGQSIRDMNVDETGTPRVDVRTAMTRNGDIYAGGGGADGTAHLWKSVDGGRVWTHETLASRRGIGDGFGILEDDTFLWVFADQDLSALWVVRSTDYGKTWSDPQSLDISPYPGADGGWPHIYQHPSGTVIITVQLRKPGELNQGLFHSEDGGKTWEKTRLCRYGCETSILALRNSDKMLAFTRFQREAIASDPADLTENTGRAKFPYGGGPFKNGVISESYDKGRTWRNFRVMAGFGSIPGELVQGLDGRVAAVWLERYPHWGAYIRVRISDDEGQTWGDMTYHMLRGTGYPSSVVRADGTVVTVLENTDLDKEGWPYRRRWVAVHWRFPDE